MVEIKKTMEDSSTIRCGEEWHDEIVSEPYIIDSPSELPLPNEYTQIARFGTWNPNFNS